MGRYSYRNVSYWETDESAPYEELSFSRVKGQANWWYVKLNDVPRGRVFKTPNGDWGALPSVYKRGQPLKGFATRHYAAEYCLWAGGIIPERQKP